MEALIIPYRISWINYLLVLAVFIGFYLLLRFADQILKRVNLSQGVRQNLKVTLTRIREIYEPIAILLGLVGFFLVRPNLHGLIILFLFVAAFNHIKNYLSGRLLVVGKRIAIGDRLRIGPLNGRVFRLGNLGCYIRDKEGLHYLNYSRIFQEGFTLIPGEEVGGMFYLHIFPTREEPFDLSPADLMDRVGSVPYLDYSFKPRYREEEDRPGHLQAQVLLREESHLRELQLLLREWGYDFEQVSE